MAFNKTLAAAFAAPAITAAERKADPANPGLTFAERGVLTMMCNMADRRTSKLFPKHATIAARLGISRATVVRSLASLEALGWVKKDRRRRRDGSRTSDLITMVMPTVMEAPARLLPLMTVVTTKVAPCNSVKVAPCDYGPGEQGCTVQQHIPNTQDSIPTPPAVEKRETDPAVREGMLALIADMKALAAGQEARRTLARRAG